VVHAIVDSVIRVAEAELPPRTLALLHGTLSFPNPDFVLRERMGRWTGATPEELCLIDRDADGRLVLPRGAASALRDALASVGERVIYDDRRARHLANDFAFSFGLRDYQDEAVRALVRHTQGVAVLPCGAGKTIIGAGAIHRCQQPALVLVHTHDLLEQWRDTLRAALEVEPGVIADGRTEPATVTVATVQTLANLAPEALAVLGARFGTVIVDECHHVPASTFREVVTAMPAFYRFGLTATLERADGLTPALTFTLGAPVFHIAHARLVDAGHLVVPEVVVVNTGVSLHADSHTALVNALTLHEARNAQLLRLATESAANHHATLVLSARVDHRERLAHRLRDAGVIAAALTSRTPRRRRAATLDAFRAGDLSVLCATSLADEGLDVSRLERLILATPARAEGRTIQRLGRLMRPHPGKRTPVLYDLVDDHPIAHRQHAARRRAYRKVLGDATPLSVLPREVA
jgi:superfamily II DNA or RNA helicase